MTNVLQIGRRTFTWGVVVTTIAWSIGLAALLVPFTASSAELSAGDLIKASLPSVYYYGADGKRYVFPNEKTFFTWYSDFSSVKTITDDELAAISIGGNATYKPGAKMVKITTDPKVYAVAAGGALRWVKTEALAEALYGANWNQQIHDVPDAFFVNYSLGADVEAAADFDKAAELAAATSIDVDKGLAAAPAPEVAAGALSVAVASDTPLAASIVADTTGEKSGQRKVAMLKANFTASSAGAVKVTGLKVKRGGISADADLDQAYLYEGAAYLAQTTSISSGYLNFSNSAGLFTVSAGAVKSIDVKIDLDYDATSGKTLNLSLAAADITSDASSVLGSAQGNTMTVAVVTDFGQLEIASVTYPADVDPSATVERELWRFRLDCLEQDLLLKNLKLTNMGSVSNGDIKDLRLLVAGVQLGDTQAQLSNKEAKFDLTGLAGGGYKCLAGQSKQLTLNGLVVGGSNRNFQFSIQEETDVEVRDLEYGVETLAAADATNAFAVIQAAAATTVNTGKLTISVASDSPSGNVSDGGVGVTLAKYTFTAAGEDVKVTRLTLTATGSDTTDQLVNTKVLLAGVQVGTTDTALTANGSDTATYSFGNSFIVPKGESKTVTLVSDLTDSTVAVDATLSASISADTSGAQGVDTLTTITVTATSGRTVTVKGGTVTIVKNASFIDRTSTLPTGVSNASGVKIASFVIVAGAGEAVDVTQIGLYDDDTYQVGDDFQNLKLKDASGSQIGATIPSPSTSQTTHTFTPSTAIRIEAGQQYVVDIFADIKSSPTNTGAARSGVDADIVSATGVNTGTDASVGTAGSGGTEVDLQIFYVAANGTLTVDEDPGRPVEQQFVMATTDQAMAKFKLTASAAEDITITQIVVADDMTNAGTSKTDATGTLKNIKLYKGSDLLGTVATLDETSNTTTPLAVFSGLNLTVPKDTNVILTVKADVASYIEGGNSSSTHKLTIPVDYSTLTAGTQDSITAVGAGSGFSISSTATSSLGLCGASVTCAASASHDVGDKTMDIVRTKLSIAHAADSPSGASVKSSEQTVAKFVVSNSANVGDYTATLQLMNLEVNQSGISITGARYLYVYQDSIDITNRLANTQFSGSTDLNGNYRATELADGDFTNMEVAAGGSRTVIVTLDTSDDGVTVNSDSLSVGIEANDPEWDDGVTAQFTEVNTLPISGKTLQY